MVPEPPAEISISILLLDSPALKVMEEGLADRLMEPAPAAPSSPSSGGTSPPSIRTPSVDIGPAT